MKNPSLYSRLHLEFSGSVAMAAKAAVLATMPVCFSQISLVADDGNARPQEASSKVYEVYIVAGQSNADGRGFINQLTGSLAPYAGPQEGVKLFYVNPINKSPEAPTHNTGWVTMAPGYSVGPGFSGGLPSTQFGFDVSLAKALAAEDPERNVAIIKVTQGGTSLNVHWNPTPGGDNYMWRTFAHQVPLALAALTADGSTANVRAMFWHQGESDGSNTDYQQHLTAFIATVRDFLVVENLPFVIGELERDHITPQVRSRTYQLGVMAAVANADPHTLVVSTEGLLTTDGTHFTSPGFVELGERMAAAFHDYLAGLTYSVTYAENEATGGSVPVDPIIYNSRATATVAGAGNLVRSEYFFAGWNTAPDGTGDGFAAGSAFMITSDVTLYAQWANSTPPPPTGLLAPLSVTHHIRGEAEDPVSRPLGYYTTFAEIIGVGGATGNREDRVSIYGYSLPTLPDGATLEGATFHFEISGARDSTGGANLPELHVYLLKSANPSGTGTALFYHGPNDPSTEVIRVGTTSVAISDSVQVYFPEREQVRAFTLSGEALELLKSFYEGPTPTRATVYFRFNMGVDPLITQFRRYNITGAAATRSVLDLSLSTAANTPPAWAGSPIIKPTATEGAAYNDSLAGLATDADNDPLTFAKASGPAWLSVAADGTLSGTPASGDVGLNSFTVTVSDGIADPVEATLQISVQSAFENWTTGEAGEGEHITFTGDANRDGLPDGIAWLLGAAAPDQNAGELLPDIRLQDDAVFLTFTYLIPGKRGDASLRLELSSQLANGPWSIVPIPDQSEIVDGVAFTVTPLPGGRLNQVQASVPLSSVGDPTFVRLSGILIQP